MPRHAWAYFWGVLLIGSLLVVHSLSSPPPSLAEWTPFLVLVTLATIAHLFKERGPSHEAWHVNLTFFFAGVFLLPFALFALLVIIPHLVEWVKERLVDSPSLRHWYIQPFNIATHIIAGFTAHWVHGALAPSVDPLSAPLAIPAIVLAVLTYVAANHLIIGQILVLARGVSWRESGILNVDNLLTDCVLTLLGFVAVLLWQRSPWLVVPALSPIVLVYRALKIPQLKREAQTDSKTGLLNAAHWSLIVTSELERAKHFGHPLALVMADLDGLRELNNSYGHLAGDAVLAGVAQIIRENVRDYDIAGRFGGEEFAIVLPETGLEGAVRLAEQLRQAIEAAGFRASVLATSLHITSSFGVASFPRDGATLDDVMHEADIALYRAKLSGKNCVVSTSDLPQSIKLEGAIARGHGTASYQAALASQRPPANGGWPSPINGLAALSAIERPSVADDTAAWPAASSRDAPASTKRSLLPWLFTIGTIVAGIVATGLGVVFGPRPDWFAVGLFVILAMIAELFEINVYRRLTMSVSVAIDFAAALITGVPGLAAASAVSVLVHMTRRRPAPYKTAFNWATHVLSGLAPALLVPRLLIPLDAPNMAMLAVTTIVASIILYVIDTGLVAAAISLERSAKLMATWREQFRWLAPYYLVLCIIGLFLALAYAVIGPLGVVVFTLPVFMMHYAQREYVKGTEASVREMRRMNEELSLANQEIIDASLAIRQLNDELFLTLSKIIDARDPDVHGHAAKLADYAAAIALEIDLPEERVMHIRQAALLHDIGKIGISETLLHKPSSLTEQEYEIIKTHTTLGADFLKTSRGLRHLAPFVKYHHERWDGAGYPDALKGAEIPLEARILAVCDAVEAMASDRSYHKAMSPEDILIELRRCAGSQFDPAVVDAFIEVIEKKGHSFIVNSARKSRRQANP